MQLTQLSMPEEFLKGRVEVSFAVYEDGQLRGVPKILESDNNDLNTIVINAIEAAAPFPAFPKDIIKDVLDFKLLFSYQ
jgi:outer membrane biosynthesis protein TonB